MSETNFITTIIGEGKGGGGTPVEAKNTLFSMQTAKAINVVSEGPIHGVANVYLDDVSLTSFNDYANANNIIQKVHVPNIYDYTIQHGESSQQVIPGFKDIQTERVINQQVTQLGGPAVAAVSHLNIDAVNVTINIPALFYIDDKGNIKGNKFSFTIEKRANSSSVWVLEKTIEIKGKCNSPYSVSYPVAAPANSGLWEVRLARTSPDKDSAKFKNGCSWSTMTEIQHSTRTYDNSALVALAVDARATNNKIPVMSFDVAGIKVKVPDNYTPRNPVDWTNKSNGKIGAKWVEDFQFLSGAPSWPVRSQVLNNASYAGSWTGTFKTAKVWCDNPAWVLYDLLTNTRYGLGTSAKVILINSVFIMLPFIVTHWYQMVMVERNQDSHLMVLFLPESNHIK